MKSKLSAAGIFFLIGVTAAQAHPGAIVLANRTAHDVTFTVAGSQSQTISPGEQAVLYADSGITVSLKSGKETRSYRLNRDAAYFFINLPEGPTLQEIGSRGSHTPRTDSSPIATDGDLAKPPPLETIPVRVFVDEEEPARQSIWEARLRKRIAAASAVLERTCRVRLEVTDAGTWESDNRAQDLHALLADFERKVPRNKARLTIGFSSQRTSEKPGTMHLGGTRFPLHPYILMREWTPASETERLEVLLHELGHYLGATHSPEFTSVMRPKLGDGRARDRRFPVEYDPLNTLAINLVAAEVRSRHIKSLQELSLPSRERLAQIYSEVQTALPDDPTPQKYLALLGTAPRQPAVSGSESSARVSELVDNSRVIIDAVIKAAEQNQRLPDRNTPGTAPPFRRSGDALTEYYFREAAATARSLPPGQAAPAYLVGLAIALDTSDLFRKNPVTGSLWRRIESDADRERRLKVLGQPTIHGRHDLCQHFVDSAALVATSGPVAAEAAGVLKEILDSQDGGSGFSFADLASDMSGVAFGRQLLAKPDRLTHLVDHFTVADYALSPDGLVEGLGFREFARRFGSVVDKRYKEQEELLRKRIQELPGQK